jgi:bifunctional DNase/RNase
MADPGLRCLLLAGAVLWSSCARDRLAPSDSPAPSPSATPSSTTPHEHRESAEPPRLDPTKKPPAGYRRMAVGGIAPTTEGNAVVLMDDTTRRGLVLFVGGTEALSITMRLERRRYDRPLTHDLLDSVLKKLGGDVVSVRVDRIENDVFYGSVLIEKDHHTYELDARPSDAIALAIGNSVPVFVAESVLSQAGVDVDKFDFRRLREVPEGKPAARAGEVEL